MPEQDCGEPRNDPSQALSDSLTTAVETHDATIAELRGVITELIDKGTVCCEVATTTIEDAATGPLDQAQRVIDRQSDIVLAEIAALIAAGQAIVAEFLGEEIEDEAEQVEEFADDVTPLEPEEDSELEDTEPTPQEKPKPDKLTPPLPTPSPAKVQIASAEETFLLTQCRNDLYSTPQFIERILSGTTSFTPQPSEEGGGFLAGILGGIGAAAGIGGAGPEAVIRQAAERVHLLAVNAGKTIANIAGCAGSATTLLPLEAIVDILGTLLFPGIGEMGLPIKYARRSFCPTAFPSSDQAHSAFQANAISEDILKSWVQLNNDCWQPQQSQIEARRNKLSAGEILSLHLRKEISRKEFTTQLREAGYLRQSDYEQIKALGVFLPPYTDIVRFMVRDVFRKDIVAKFGMDVLFEDAFSDEAEALTDKQGIQRETMQQLWRAHWSIPAPGQLFDMLHRLPHVSDEFIEDSNRRLQKLDPSLSFTRDDIQEDKIRSDAFDALVQQDILPFWIPRLLALTFRPLTRREITRAVEAGVLEGEAIIPRYRELGMSADSAIVLKDLAEARRDLRAGSLEPVRLYKAETIDRAEVERRLTILNIGEARIVEVLKDAAKSQENHSAVKLYKAMALTRKIAGERLAEHGIPAEVYNAWLDDIDIQRTSHEAADLYGDGVQTKAEAEATMQRDGLDLFVITKLLKAEDDKLDASLLKFCGGQIEKRFIEGELSEADAERELGIVGMSPRLAKHWQDRMACKRESQDKMPTLAMLTGWLDLGVLNPTQFLLRLANLGFKQDDAFDILQAAVAKMEESRAKQITQDAKKAQRQADKLFADEKRRRKQTAAQLKARGKAREAADKARERRERRLVEAADRLRQITGAELPAALTAARMAVRIGSRDFGLGPDERLETLETAVKRFKTDDPQDFIARYRVLAAARQNAEAFA